MQPYFFPYWGHFSLIAHTCKWIIFDECQYKPKSWMNRNRILHPTKSWQYITVPLSNSSRNITVSEARILNPREARVSIIRKLEHYKNKANRFFIVTDIIDEAFKKIDSENSLTSLCEASIHLTCKYLGITCNPTRSSQLKICYPENMNAGQWAPCIAENIGATGYLNPINGASLFKISEFNRRNLELKFLETKSFDYMQGPFEECKNLSILDTLMWISPEKIKSAIESNVSIVDGGKHLATIQRLVANCSNSIFQA